MLNLNASLTKDEFAEMSNISPNAWFTQVKFANGLSPRCQEASTLDANHEMKKRLMMPWIQENIRGKRVLDLFSANGAFAFECALAGAQEVVGIEFDEDRVRCPICSWSVAAEWYGRTAVLRGRRLQHRRSFF